MLAARAEETEAGGKSRGQAIAAPGRTGDVGELRSRGWGPVARRAARHRLLHACVCARVVDEMSMSASSVHPALNHWQRLARLLFLLLGMSCLVAGVWGGLLRSMVNLPLPVHHANWITLHGPLMVCAFLGTLIGLERAVALRAGWTYLAPLLCGLGGLGASAGMTGTGPRWAWVAGSAIFVAVSLRIYRIQPAGSGALQGLGALAWLAGNLQWVEGREIPEVVLFWLVFLLWLIAGERLELTRFQRPVASARILLLLAVATVLAGLVGSEFDPRAGGICFGIGIVGTALWLGRFDLAWRTVRFAGLPRFMALCLLMGYSWLAVAGLWIAWAWPQTSGVAYDGALHAFFVGFVFSMILGHAPVIFPSILGLTVKFRSWSYLPLVILHGSLALRLIADGLGWGQGRAWGALGNGVSIALFLMTMVLTHAVPPKHSQACTPPGSGPEERPGQRP